MSTVSEKGVDQKSHWEGEARVRSQQMDGPSDKEAQRSEVGV